MELNFAKTAPGVMTASWTHPKKGRQVSIAIIESCDTQHLFIDGELIARELPTFDDAVTLAKQKLNASNGSGLVRIAGALVIASLIGASVVAASMYMPAISPAEIAAATSPATSAEGGNAKQARAEPKDKGTQAVSFNTDRDAKPSRTEIEPAAVEAAAKPIATPKEVAVTVIEPAAAPTDTSGTDNQTTTETDGRRRFSARNNLLALEAHLAKQRTAARQEKAAPKAPEIAAVEATSEPELTPEASATSTPTLALAPAAPSMAAIAPASKPAASAPQPREAQSATIEVPSKPLIRPMLSKGLDDGADEAAQPAATRAGPPLPAQAPTLAQAPLNVASDNAETAGEPTFSEETATAEPKASTKRRHADRPARKSYRSKSRRLPHRSRRAPSRRVVTAAPQKRLVCFAHICRWQ